MCLPTGYGIKKAHKTTCEVFLPKKLKMNLIKSLGFMVELTFLYRKYRGEKKELRDTTGSKQI